ncbi:hypothetical protein DFH09DRAFT_1306319 [Mycena vulgaris]|nr:hypothetical protein DFH09DRAFT_1306319 [Mycena vulgaris]
MTPAYLVQYAIQPTVLRLKRAWTTLSIRMFILSVLSLLTLALVGHGYPGHAPSAGPPCADAVILSNATIQVGAAQVLMSGFSCGVDAEPKRSSLAARDAPRDICNFACTIVSCDAVGTGDVPAASDCGIIADAIDVLSSTLGPTYLLNSSNGYFKQFVHGTCLTYIAVSSEKDTEACWSDWASIIRQLLSACPGSPIGACTSIPPAQTFAAFSME